MMHQFDIAFRWIIIYEQKVCRIQRKLENQV
ncbi:hypothetical protein HDG38_006035 [Paraburkholderia sp. WSM4177]|nr:hypothetical protein [Paraburkholderia sp. WSM4177]MBB5484072.1 hypothetical protein [Paraburkholderia sp. WSM4180]